MNFFLELNMALQNTVVFSIFFFIIGASLGSFFNVVAFRFPLILDYKNSTEIKYWMEEKGINLGANFGENFKDINLSFPSSHCFSCGKSLKWYHNIPIFSYLFLKGKCGFCSTPYSIQYPIVEFFGGLLFMTVYYTIFPKYGLNIFMLASIFFMTTYLLLIIDFKTMLLPDEYNFGLMWIGLIALANNIKIVDNITLEKGLYGAVIGYLILWFFSTVGRKLKGVDVMGDGDLKLVAAIGAFLGLYGVIFTIFFAPFIGIITWIYFKFKKSENPEFPFGPSLIISSWIYIVYYKEILNYFQLM